MLELESWPAAFPLELQTDSLDPKLVLVSARKSRDSGASVQCSVPSFGRTSDGISIPAVTGLTAGTRYDVVVLLIGVK